VAFFSLTISVTLSITNYSPGEERTDVILYDDRFACACDLFND
jgi:hypothetical protein